MVASQVAADPLPVLDPQLAGVTSLAKRITYTSTTGINDSDHEVTAVVFAPKGTPPPGGWPMVAFGHRASGIRPECAPSLSPTLAGESGVVAELVKAGFVVAVPDYQGLGLNTLSHPFLDSTTEGYNLIDSMSAFGAIPVSSRDVTYDAVAASSNKCIEGVPGFSYVLVKRTLLEEYRLQGRGGQGLIDIKTFNRADGFSWVDSGGRQQSADDWKNWIGKRAQSGRLAPRGFNKNGRFTG